MPASVTLGFTGDVMLGRLVDERQRRDDRSPSAVWGDVRERLAALDGLCINLECCLSTRGRRWTRTYRPFHFRADPSWAVPALRAVGVDWACLANNHLLDFEAVALRDTLDALDDAGIAHAGAGLDLEAAWAPSVVDVGGLRVGLVAFTDNTPEFAAGSNSPGTAHARIDLDDEATREAVTGALADARAADADLLVASLHWGPNMRIEPPEQFREFARWLVDAGVDVVHGHSAHVFQGVEVYEGAPVIYDAGDFVDDYEVDADLRNDRSFLFELDVEGGDPAELTLVPTEIDDCAARLASGGAAEWSRERMRELSEPFGTAFERDGECLTLAL